MGLDQVQGADKMLKVFLLALTATSCLAMGGEEEKRIRRIIDAWNLESECWGRDNMLPYWAKRSQAIKQCAKYGSPDADLSPENPFSALNANQPNPISRLLDQALTNELPTNGDNGWSDLLGGLDREPRQSRPIAARAGDQIQQFLNGFSNHKEQTATKLGNLTCVMAELGKVDSKMAINMDYFMNKLWTNIDLSKSLEGEGHSGLHRLLQPGHVMAQSNPGQTPSEESDEKILHQSLGARLATGKWRQL